MGILDMIDRFFINLQNDQKVGSKKKEDKEVIEEGYNRIDQQNIENNLWDNQNQNFINNNQYNNYPNNQYSHQYNNHYNNQPNNFQNYNNHIPNNNQNQVNSNNYLSNNKNINQNYTVNNRNNANNNQNEQEKIVMEIYYSLNKNEEILKWINKDYIDIISKDLLLNPYTINMCGHNFNFNSITHWLNYDNTCPICKIKFQFNNLIKNYLLQQKVMEELDNLQNKLRK